MAYEISGTKSETARVLILKELDWSVEYNTVISGSGAYSISTLSSGVKMVVSRTPEGEVIGYCNVEALVYVPPGPVDDEWWAGYFDNTYWNADDPDWGEWDAVNEKWIPAAAYDYEVDINVKSGTDWATDYRPTSVKLTIENDPGDLKMTIADSNGSSLKSQEDISSGSEVVFGSAWQWPKDDIGIILAWSDSEIAGWAITGIEFFTDTVTNFNLIECEFILYGDSPEKILWAENLKIEEQGDLYLTGSPNQPDNLRFYWPSDIGKGQYAHLTNIEFLNGSTWEQKFDNTFWQNYSDFTWNNGRWESAADGARLEAIGTWADTYYPTAVRISFVIV